MNVVLVTVMRDSEEYVERFWYQATQIEGVHVVIVEGDSSDRTWELMNLKRDQWARVPGPEFTLLKAEHGGPRFGSVDDPLRWRQLGAVCEVALTAGVRLAAGNVPLIYVESDLVWDGRTMERLAMGAVVWDAVAPMSMHQGRFYDVWGHVKDGAGFRFHAPYFPGWNPDAMHAIDSAGSCFALSPRAQQYAHFSPIDCIRGIGRSLRENGVQLWLDPHTFVEHP